MPTYLFLNNLTGEEYEDFMSISNCDEYLINNSHITQLVHGAPMIISGVSKKPDQGFRDVLRTIKKQNSKGFKRSTVNTF